jgi:hypothetical protein
MELYKTFIKLFPRDVANIIILYVGKALIIKLQNDSPRSLANIMLHKNEIPNIHRKNYQYITRLDHSNNNKQINPTIIKSGRNINFVSIFGLLSI